MTLRQRQPRVEDPAYLAYVRSLPCLICGRGPSDPAHIRAAAPLYGKRYTGKGEKPDDKWAVPLCRVDHADQHRRNELQWWASKGIPDPFTKAEELYAGRPGASKPPVERRRRKRSVAARKPRAQRQKISGRSDIPSRGFPDVQRAIPSRPLVSGNKRK